MFKKAEPANQNEDHKYFSIFDSKVGVYKAPFLAMNKMEVLRDFENMMRDPEQRRTNTYFLNAEDYAIYEVGSWSKKTGVITPVNAQHVVNLHEIRSMVERQLKPQGEPYMASHGGSKTIGEEVQSWNKNAQN